MISDDALLMDAVNVIRGTERVRIGTGSIHHARRIRLEGIQFRSEIGRGRGTVVYRALRQSDHSEIVVKVLVPVGGMVSPRCDGFIQAGRRQRAINQPNLMACFDADCTSDFGYQILELAQGQDLARRLTTTGPMEYKQALGLVVGAARGIEAMAKEDVVHGAIAPHNIFMTQLDEAVVAVPSGPLPPYVDAIGQLTLHRTMLGCVAPEVLLGESTCTTRGDIYSLGSLLRVLITADQTRRVTSWDELVAVMTGVAAGSDDEVPGLPDGVNAVLRKALAIDPTQRYARVSHLREDFERVHYDFSPIHARSQPTVTMQRRRSWSATATETLPASHLNLTVDLPDEESGAADEQVRPLTGIRVIAPGLESNSPELPVEPRSAFNARLPWLAAALVLILGLMIFVMQTHSHQRPTGPTRAFVEAPFAPERHVATPIPSNPEMPAHSVIPMTNPAAGSLGTLTRIPNWASAAGADVWGRWAELEIRGVTQRFRYCRPGSFWMGSPIDEDGRRDDEKRTLVTLTHGFWMGESEVTQQLFQAVMEDNPSSFHGPTLPVDSLTYDRSLAFMAKVSQLSGAQARIPTEAEWEYACRAGSNTAYSVPPENGGWSRETSATTTHPVKELRANAWGLYDMEGNVLEWCQDTFDNYPGEAVNDPCATGGIFQVARGGAWSLPATECRSAARHHYESVAKLFFLGVRLLIADTQTAPTGGSPR